MLCLLLVFQLIGEIVAYLLNGVVPGPVLGMALIATVFSMARRLGVLNNVRRQVASVSTESWEAWAFCSCRQASESCSTLI